MRLKLLDLFSGLGGFSLGLEKTGHFKTIAFCDNDKYCKLVLQKHWKEVKIYDDVKEITKERLEADGVKLPEIITGGFPCQPFSVAGKQKGTSDDRYLWPEMFRIIQELKPRWVIGENVKGITNIQDGMVFETVCTDLEGEGYEVRAFNIPAAGVGAPHRRERIWIVAHAKCFSDSESIEESDGAQDQVQKEHRQDDSSARLTSRTSSIRQTNNGHDVANTESLRFRGRSGQERGIKKQEFQQSEQERSEVRSEVERRSSQSSTDVANAKRVYVQGQQDRPRQEQSRRSGWWHVEPNVGRVAHGVPGRVHRLKGLGNSIIPKIAEEIGNAIIKAERLNEME